MQPAIWASTKLSLPIAAIAASDVALLQAFAMPPDNVGLRPDLEALGSMQQAEVVLVGGAAGGPVGDVMGRQVAYLVAARKLAGLVPCLQRAQERGADAAGLAAHVDAHAEAEPCSSVTAWS